jgi:hypothetical protein
MTRKVWQAEVQRGERQLDIDFPERQTKDEARDDAIAARSDFSGRELARREAWICEWELSEDGGEKRGTGQAEQVW